MCTIRAPSGGSGARYPRPRQIVLPTLVLLSGVTAGCGGGGGGGGDTSYLYPLWVPTDTVVSDLDDDGRADVLSLAHVARSESQREGSLTVYRQTNAGSFAAPDSYRVGIYPWRMAVGDIDGDGAPDLVVSDVDARAVWLLRQKADQRGRFDSPQQIAAGVYSYESAIADLNGDGTSDIAIVDDLENAARLVLLYQDPAQRGTFQSPVDFAMPGSTSNITAGDLNGDRRADLLTWFYKASSGYTPNGALAITLQHDDVLGPTATLADQTGFNVARLAIADYDGDGSHDLLAYFTPWSSQYRAKLTVLLQGTLPGSFGPPRDTSLAEIRGIDDATFADLNADGRPDAAVVGFFPVGSPSRVESRLNLLFQSGGGGFALSAVHDMPIAVSRVTAGDVDGDGRNDLVVLGDDNQCFVLIQSHNAPGLFQSPRPLR